jgi:ectoine hydroxylase-related dioxygenase (phytanoyl-CoA dioxygenase family)
MSSAAAEKIAYRIVPSADFLESNDALSQPAELQRRLKEQGYLFFRGLLNRERLTTVRRDILSLCQEHGWLKGGSELLDAVYSGIPFPDYTREYMPLYRKLIKLESFNQFSHSPELVQLFEIVLQSKILVHPRNIARITFPRHHAFTTQPHQDFFYIRGTPETYTAWIPVGDCPRELGGLTLMEGSHAFGFLKHESAIGAGNNGVRVDQMSNRWLSTDYRAGDVVIMHSHTIHAAMDNDTPDRLRLSLDFRYQRQGDDVDPSSLQPHYG